jgi:hypothetical protein
MAETLGSLCDKLTVVKLKQWHTTDEPRLTSLGQQARQLAGEIDQFLDAALSGGVPRERLRFASNKVFHAAGNQVAQADGTVGQVFAALARVNCALWHEQEKVYEFEKVPMAEKDGVVRKLAILNLERNQCIDAIDRCLVDLLESNECGSPR